MQAQSSYLALLNANRLDIQVDTKFVILLYVIRAPRSKVLF